MLNFGTIWPGSQFARNRRLPPFDIHQISENLWTHFGSQSLWRQFNVYSGYTLWCNVVSTTKHFIYRHGRYLENRYLSHHHSGENYCLLALSAEKRLITQRWRDLGDWGDCCHFGHFGGLLPMTRYKWQHVHRHMPMHMRKCIEAEISPTFPFLFKTADALKNGRFGHKDF